MLTFPDAQRGVKQSSPLLIEAGATKFSGESGRIGLQTWESFSTLGADRNMRSVSDWTRECSEASGTENHSNDQT
jgi:hypothetical protein